MRLFARGRCLPVPSGAFRCAHSQDRLCTGLSEETKLLLYALEKQSMEGPCTQPKPWGWNVVENAKYQAWKQLGDMSQNEAMRLYVRTLEEEAGEGWWSAELLTTSGAERAAATDGTGAATETNAATETKAADAATANGTGQRENSTVDNKKNVKRRSVAEVLVEGSWVSPYIDDAQRPTPRYEHSMALLGSKAYLIGGNYAGRYIADTWCLDLESLAWSQVVPSSSSPSSLSEGGTAGLPPSAGHAAVGYNGSVVLVGGHERLERVKGKVKSFSPMKVHRLDPIGCAWSDVATTGVVPLQRGGHSVNLIAHKLYMFGGENPNRKPSNELFVLDLKTNEWSQPEVAGEAPIARSSHSAVTYLDRYIVVFGGGSVANCYNDVVVLDTQTMTWTRPETIGQTPPIRAGHASAVLGSLMYMIGGGNNAKGCADMYSLDLKNLGTERGTLEWVLIGNTPPESAIASEGLSLTCLPMAGCVLSYGGYNGKYHSAIHVFRPESYVLEALQEKKSLSQDPSMRSLASDRERSERSERSDRPEREASGRDSPNGASGTLATQARLESTSLEVDIMRRQLASANKALEEAEKVAEAAREALAEEEQRNMQLQVQVSELRKEADRARELERELQRYRLRDSQGGNVQGKKTGIWGYIAGSDRMDDN